ncbi:hypothetical protein [Streptomyces sp. NPDC047315]|uniref:hypothetical protein n=1 Tax=Streptomyces sp. NPDC047315 TaxID=3155142 RepID=UPI0033ECB992
MTSVGSAAGGADHDRDVVVLARDDSGVLRMVETDRRRSAPVSELIDGPSPSSDTVWEMARMLDFPFQGRFLVVTAEVPTGGAPPLPGLDRRLRALKVGAAWRAQPGSEIGVLSCPPRLSVEDVLAAVRAVATGRVGVSPLAAPSAACRRVGAPHSNRVPTARHATTG